ncbi:MAG: hypothetical protein H7144_16020 [Burkholderiales bacterium]|nr:hypothetical protein [Phycisphaerae bacterium]
MADDLHKLAYQRAEPLAPPNPDAQRVIITDPEHYRQIMLKEKSFAGGMDIGGEGVGRRMWRLLGWAVVVLLVAAAFTFLFYHFTNNLRVALAVVIAMLLYMLASAYLAEGNLDRRDRE